jgi:hypothetical protein
VKRPLRTEQCQGCGEAVLTERSLGKPLTLDVTPLDTKGIATALLQWRGVYKINGFGWPELQWWGDGGLRAFLRADGPSPVRGGTYLASHPCRAAVRPFPPHPGGGSVPSSSLTPAPF